MKLQHPTKPDPKDPLHDDIDHSLATITLEKEAIMVWPDGTKQFLIPGKYSIQEERE